MLSEALTVTVDLLETSAPLAGAVIAAVGDVVSGTMVMATAAEVPEAAALSVARAVSV